MCVYVCKSRGTCLKKAGKMGCPSGTGSSMCIRTVKTQAATQRQRKRKRVSCGSAPHPISMLVDREGDDDDDAHVCVSSRDLCTQRETQYIYSHIIKRMRHKGETKTTKHKACTTQNTLERVPTTLSPRTALKKMGNELFSAPMKPLARPLPALAISYAHTHGYKYHVVLRNRSSSTVDAITYLEVLALPSRNYGIFLPPLLAPFAATRTKRLVWLFFSFFLDTTYWGA